MDAVDGVHEVVRRRKPDEEAAALVQRQGQRREEVLRSRLLPHMGGMGPVERLFGHLRCRNEGQYDSCMNLSFKKKRAC